ncbi:mitochondrial outer membrane translocase complex, subunit Tom5 [Xylariaceae sp. FL0016]|nr:mitochondrial outer membrane translocase complex, subunit Tom5 [Xylariaceae sp. FL0016]
MFGAGPGYPPKIPDEEMQMMEAEANFTVKAFLATAATLYISPFIIDAVSSVF